VGLATQAVRRGSPAVCFQELIELRTQAACHFHDITDAVQDFLRGCDVGAGMVLLHSLHTTAGLLVNEAETGFRADFAETAERLASCNTAYRHDDLSVRWENLCPEDAEAPNGHSHLQHSMFGAVSVVLPVRDGRLVLGTWQRVFLIEYDRPRDRTVLVQAFGLLSDDDVDARLPV
jgi:secondary thiamine-phosphate synthase enzyme